MPQYQGIYVQRGVTVTLKKAYARRKRRGERPREDPTCVSVRDVCMGETSSGTFYVRTPDVKPPISLTSKWSSLALKRLETRLRDGDGGAKGRVLYGWIEPTLSRPPAVVAALCFHLAAGGKFWITDPLVSGELSDHRGVMWQALTIVGERIALCTSNGNPTHIYYDVPRDDARFWREQMGFHEHAKSTAKSRVIICRDVNPANHLRALRRG